MAKIHPTSTVTGEVDLAPDVEVGPYCWLEGPIRIGSGTTLMGHNYLRGPLVIGEGNRLYPFVCLGYEPQDFKYDPSRPGAGLVIGDGNLFREHMTAHRATSDDVPTRIGDGGMFMVCSHVGHDAQVGHRCVFTNCAQAGGHSITEDQVIIAGCSGLAQHVRVGRLAFISATEGATAHVPPFMMSRTKGTVGGINIVGLRRSGMPRDEIDAVKWAFRILYYEGLTRPAMIERLSEREAESAAVREMAVFLRRIKGPMSTLEPGKEPGKEPGGFDEAGTVALEAD